MSTSQDRSLRVTAALREDILSGELGPGERLVEAALTERYSVGRGAIRAALIALRSEGLVDIAPNRGASVRRVSLREAIQIAEARRALECLIARQAALQADENDNRELQEVLRSMTESVDEGDNRAYSRLNARLHELIMHIGRHHVASDLVENLRNRGAHHQYRLAVMPGRSEQSLAQHRAIVEAIVSGDEVGASQAMHAHLSSVIEVLSNWADAGVSV